MPACRPALLEMLRLARSGRAADGETVWHPAGESGTLTPCRPYR